MVYIWTSVTMGMWLILLKLQNPAIGLCLGEWHVLTTTI